MYMYYGNPPQKHRELYLSNIELYCISSICIDVCIFNIEILVEWEPRTYPIPTHLQPLLLHLCYVIPYSFFTSFTHHIHIHTYIDQFYNIYTCIHIHLFIICLYIFYFLSQLYIYFCYIYQFLRVFFFVTGECTMIDHHMTKIIQYKVEL